MVDSVLRPAGGKVAPGGPEATVQLIVFQLAGEDYGVRIEQVREVTVTPEVARMPKTPAFIKGIINLRGDIIAVIDLEERFGLVPAGRPLPAHSYTVAVEAAEYTIGLAVRDVPRPMRISAAAIEAAPEFLQDSGQRERYLEGIAKLPDNSVIIVLDMRKLLMASEILRLPN